MEYKLLSAVKSNKDIKSFTPQQLEELSREIRAYLLETVSKTGGHLASNLGAVELTVALNYVFSTPEDSIIFDVGHQSYAHKIINDRFGQMASLRSLGGISGFPKREESEHDSFNTGHASTSVSAAVGIMRANKLMGREGRAVAVIGDGALGGGMVFEALNDAGQTRTPVIMVLNDNGMSISKNTGALSQSLSRLRSSHGYLSFKHSTKSFLSRIPVVGPALKNRLDGLKDRIKFFLLPRTLFEEFDITYLGPVDGHDVAKLTGVLESAKRIDKPVLIHVITQKGRGYAPAEEMPEKFHGVSASDIANGCAEYEHKKSNSSVFGEELLSIARSEPRLAAITAAMTDGTGLAEFKRELPERFFDVGIAEQHAVTMAAGLAAGGMLPVVAIYSTFLQRAYDQLLHDVCLQKLHVVFAVDRAGLVGEDGETHQGAFDIAYLYSMPNMTVLSPSSEEELRFMLRLALAADGPVAIRYGRGLLSSRAALDTPQIGKWRIEAPISKLTVIASGRTVDVVRPLCDELGCGLVNALTVKPLDREALASIAATAEKLLVVEDAEASCSLACHIKAELSGSCIRVYNIGLPDMPLPHGSVCEQDALCGLTREQLRTKLTELGRADG